ncbi:MAG: 23Sr RNA gene [uncultured Thermomicrobiales bacterium]|uniref:23Sr RNA protein n=1 Tax=uncultured Thermomicrobiales bacterium TaxID=1645740 RepID=A0A6J4UXS1_9BACT|nr:MAG: 23Sr RNA gene [uncultured Thermomicrobiales bacterium]
MVVQSYRDLVAWRKSMLLVRAIYETSHSWPREELHGLTSQARRAAVSVPANIAEGQGRTGTREFTHHLSIAKGSLHELETLILIAHDLDYIDATACNALLAQATEVARLIGGLLRRLRTLNGKAPSHDSRLATHDSPGGTS